jgi:hypothetical protein
LRQFWAWNHQRTLAINTIKVLVSTLEIEQWPSPNLWGNIHALQWYLVRLNYNGIGIRSKYIEQGILTPNGYNIHIMNPNMSLGSKDLLVSFIKIYIESYISLERFVQYRFLKLLSTNIPLFKEFKYVSSQKLQSMALQKWLQRISNIKILKKTP